MSRDSELAYEIALIEYRKCETTYAMWKRRISSNKLLVQARILSAALDFHTRYLLLETWSICGTVRSATKSGGPGWVRGCYQRSSNEMSATSWTNG